MTTLVRYDAARAALAEAHRVDEVRDIRDKAVAMQIYAKQAKDTELIDHATEIRIRAERRAGELLREMADRGERDVGGRGALGSREKPNSPPTLADLGVTKTQSSRWQRLADLDDQAFEARVETAKRQAVASVEMTAAEKMAEKRERREEREADLGARQAALPAQKFGLILADPEWRFEPYSRDTGMDRAADNHYPTSDLEAIKARDVAAIAADDCILFLWATAPMLPQALDVMAAWGFAYRSHFVWAKDRIGTGYWNRNKHELLLIGVRGDIPAPTMGTQAASIIEAPITRHSEKPEVSYNIIESYFPNLPKIELNARRARSGWASWGNEVEESAA